MAGVQRGRRRTQLIGLIDRVSALAEMALAPDGLRFLRAKPRSVTAYRLTAGIARAGIRPMTVIDVGANVGQFAGASLTRWPEASVIAFEALPELAEGLRLLLGADRHMVHAVALGASDGTVMFHRHAYSPSSSVLAATSSAESEYAWARDSAVQDVPLRQLDGLIAQHLPLGAPVLMKLDVQGYEHEVLAGATETLKMSDALVIEHAFEPFYDGQRSFTEMHESLRAGGWTMARVLDVRREQGVAVEADCLYLKTGGADHD